MEVTTEELKADKSDATITNVDVFRDIRDKGQRYLRIV
jgi:hypothetical protein